MDTAPVNVERVITPAALFSLDITKQSDVRLDRPLPTDQKLRGFVLTEQTPLLTWFVIFVRWKSIKIV